MAQFASDAFAGSAATELSAYSGSWSKNYAAGVWGNNANIGVDGQYACNFSTSTRTAYVHSGSPAGADYSVSATVTIVHAGNDDEIGVVGRAVAGADTMYCLYYDETAEELRLAKIVTGSTTTLDTYSVTFAEGTQYTLKLEMIGTAIKGYLDGVERVSATDSDISAAGKAGIFLFSMRLTATYDTSGLDSFSADDIGGGGGSSTGAAMSYLQQL